MRYETVYSRNIKFYFQIIDGLIENYVTRRQRGSVVRVGDLYAEDPGSNPRLGLLNEFVLGDPRDKTHHALLIANWFASYQLGFLTGREGF